MNLLYDLSYTQNRDTYSGIFEYGKIIFNELVKNKGSNNISIILLKNYAIDQWILESKCNIEYIESEYGSKNYWKEIEKIMYSYDRIFLPYQLIDAKIKVPKNCELYMTIHDVAQIELVKYCKINSDEKYYRTKKDRLFKYKIKQLVRLTGLWWRKVAHILGKNVKNASKIITISDYSKNQIMKYYKIDDSKIEVLFPPLKFLPTNLSSNLDKHNYFLLVSASRYTKNAKRALEALDIIWDSNIDFPSAIVTGNLPTQIMDKIKHKEKVELMGYVDAGDLEYLYKNTEALIFPSLCEGFGSPPLEAMRYGTRVICSNAMSLSELYGDLPLFDPYDIKDISEKILNYKELNSKKMISIYNRIVKKCEEDSVAITKILLSD